MLNKTENGVVHRLTKLADIVEQQFRYICLSQSIVIWEWPKGVLVLHSARIPFRMLVKLFGTSSRRVAGEETNQHNALCNLSTTN